MKVVVSDTKKAFEPITLTLTIESEDELCGLWHRFNVALIRVKEVSEAIPQCPSFDNSTAAWDAINNACISLGIVEE